MKIGDLVVPLNSCGGKPGGKRCKTAIILNSESVYVDVQVDSCQYITVEKNECELMCSCGKFREEEEFLKFVF